MNDEKTLLHSGAAPFDFRWQPMDVPAAFELLFCPGDCCRSCALARGWIKAARVGGEDLGRWYRETPLMDVRDVLATYWRFKVEHDAVDLSRRVEERLPFPSASINDGHRIDALRYGLSALGNRTSQPAPRGVQPELRIENRDWIQGVRLPDRLRFPGTDIEVFAPALSPLLPNPNSDKAVLTIGYYELEDTTLVQFGAVRYCSVGEAIRRERNGENVDIVLNADHPRARFCEMFFRDVKAGTASRWRGNSDDGWSHKDSLYGKGSPSR